MKATKLLKEQHREVEDLFAHVLDSEDAEERREGLEQIKEKLEAHMAIEEQIFYPAVREAVQTKKIQEMIPEAYERLLLDALEGDASLFARADEVEASWTICDPILDEWQRSDQPQLNIYEPNLWGPEESTQWMADQGRQWFDICPVLH